MCQLEPPKGKETPGWDSTSPGYANPIVIVNDMAHTHQLQGEPFLPRTQPRTGTSQASTGAQHVGTAASPTGAIALSPGYSDSDLAPCQGAWRDKRWPRVIGLCHPLWRPGWTPWLLCVSAPALVHIWGVNPHMEYFSLCL